MNVSLELRNFIREPYVLRAFIDTKFHSFIVSPQQRGYMVRPLSNLCCAHTKCVCVSVELSVIEASLKAEAIFITKS